LPQTNPATEEVFVEVAVASREDLDRAVDGAQKAFEQSWRDLTPGKRTDILFNIARKIRENLEPLAQLESRNIGKPISDARDEVALGARIFEYYAGAVTKFCGQTIPVARGGFDFTLRQPMGVVAGIVPWNFPFPIACWKVAPCTRRREHGRAKTREPIATHCADARPACVGRRASRWRAASARRSGAELGDALVQHPLVRKISFTGSTAVGSRIMSMAARDIKRVSLELGGKSPNIVFADADLEQAASSAPMSVFANCGQDCCARSRVFRRTQRVSMDSSSASSPRRNN
jgi:betaine-aldehyde dehydrogenase